MNFGHVPRNIRSDVLDETESLSVPDVMCLMLLSSTAVSSIALYLVYLAPIWNHVCIVHRALQIAYCSAWCSRECVGGWQKGNKLGSIPNPHLHPGRSPHVLSCAKHRLSSGLKNPIWTKNQIKIHISVVFKVLLKDFFLCRKAVLKG